MTDLGVPNYFLGVEVVCSVHGLTMSLTKYILNLLEWANIIGSEPLCYSSGFWLQIDFLTADILFADLHDCCLCKVLNVVILLVLFSI